MSFHLGGAHDPDSCGSHDSDSGGAHDPDLLSKTDEGLGTVWVLFKKNSKSMEIKNIKSCPDLVTTL